MSSDGDQQKCRGAIEDCEVTLQPLVSGCDGLGPGHRYEHFQLLELSIGGTMIDGETRKKIHVCIDNNSQLYNSIELFDVWTFHSLRRVFTTIWEPFALSGKCIPILAAMRASRTIRTNLCKTEELIHGLLQFPPDSFQGFKLFGGDVAIMGSIQVAKNTSFFFVGRSFFSANVLGRSFWWKSETKQTKDTSTYVKSLSTGHQHVTKIHIDLLTPTFWLDPMFDSSLTRVYR